MWRRKKSMVWIILPFALTAVFCLWFDFNVYESRSKTISCEDDGIIFSITTFNGDSETTPFLKCLGHTWLSIDNQSGHSVYIKDHEIKHDEMITFSVWAVSDLPGLLFNLEEAYISTYDRYVGRKSLSVNIGEPQLKIIEAYIDQKDKWSLGKNCSYWSVRLWNEVVDEAFGLKTQTLFYTPKRLERSFCEFDCVEADKDFSRAGHICLYNGTSCVAALHKAGKQPYLLSGTERFDFVGYHMMAAMYGVICIAITVMLILLVRWKRRNNK